MPKVSVLMPVYNTKEEYLREAIESILNQTFTDFEFIILNDGSTDENVEKVIKSYADKRIKYLYKENTGIADTLNFGLSQVKGEYVARMDSDDISLPERFKRQVEFLDKNKEFSLVSALYEQFPEYYVPNHPARVGLIDLLVKGCVVAHPLVMFRKQDFQNRCLKYDEKLLCAQDYDLWSRVLMAGLKIANIQEVLLKYRWYPDNISHTKRQLQEQIAREVKNHIISYLTDEKIFQKKLYDLISPSSFSNKKNVKCYLFNIIPFLKIKSSSNKKKILLFGFIPILKVKEK